ncbi:MAG: hypothetical protein AVDCRST_MAG24-1870, partial [uncultured Nocardioidaceae bacterium]
GCRRAQRRRARGRAGSGAPGHQPARRGGGAGARGRCARGPDRGDPGLRRRAGRTDRRNGRTGHRPRRPARAVPDGAATHARAAGRDHRPARGRRPRGAHRPPAGTGGPAGEGRGPRAHDTGQRGARPPRPAGHLEGAQRDAGEDAGVREGPTSGRGPAGRAPRRRRV